VRQQPLFLAEGGRCDRRNRLRGSPQAVAKTLAALCGVDYRGCAEVVARPLEGFKALPAPIEPDPDWREVLGVSQRADPAVIEAAYRALTKRTHPDVGGDLVRFRQISTAYHAAKGVLAR
jgi:DnaJ-domain-containing protein 1